MSASAWLHQVHRRWLGPRPTPARRCIRNPASASRVVRPQLEALEDRLTPTVFTPTVSPTSLSFGFMLLGTTSAAQTVTVTNPAGAAIVNSVGPIRQVVQASTADTRRYLVIASGSPEQLGQAVQIQLP